jgi:hypothetical protein
MRSLFLALLLALPGSAATVSAAGLDIVRVWPGYRTADSFDRIGDYFGSDENRRGETIRRSQPAAREGYYFLMRLKNPGAALTGARFELQVISPASPEPRTYAFTADVPAGGQVYELGVTGRDWPGAKTSAVAWQLVVSAPDGSELVRRQSFLWTKPDGASLAK